MQSNKDDFLSQFHTMSVAAVNVHFIRSREPFRVTQTIQEYAEAKRSNFLYWDRTTGLEEYAHDNTSGDAKKIEGHEDVVGLLEHINTSTPKRVDGRDVPEFWAIVYPHWELPQIPNMIQMLATYSRTFPDTNKHLSLVVPEGFEPPAELTDCVTVMDFDIPTHSELIDVVVDSINFIHDDNTRPQFSDEEIEQIASAAAGMTEQSAEDAISRALVEHTSELPNVSAADFAASVGKIKAEVVKKSEVLEVMKVGNIDDIGGLDNLKEWIMDRRACFTDEARDYGVDAPRGVALIGPPGTGKSLSAKAIASTLGQPLIQFDVSRVFNSLVGSSEARVRSALKMLDAMAPCVVYLDEVDKAFDMNSGGGDSGVGKRVLGAILTHLQESPAPLFWVMTANRTEGLPPEMLRKGRLDEVFSVSVPNADERRAIFDIHLRKRKQSTDISDMQVAIDRSEGYVPAELEAAVKEAVVRSFSRDIPLTGQLIADQLDNMKPLSEAFSEQFEAMRTWAENNARPASSGDRPSITPRARTRNRKPDDGTASPNARRRGRSIGGGGEGNDPSTL